MDFEQRNSERKKMLHSKRSIYTVIEISKKINELLEQMEYDNNEMLLTKGHIKHNLIQLMNHAKFQNKIQIEPIKKSTEEQNLQFYINFSQNYYIDNRGRLITNYAK